MSFNFVQSIIKFSLGVLIIGIIIWNRFLHKREPQIFTDMTTNHVLIFTSFCFSLIFLLLLIGAIYNINKNNNKEIDIMRKFLNNKIFLLFSKSIATIKDSPIFVYEKITGNTRLAWLIEKPASYFTAYANYPRVFVISFYFIPQIIVATTFLIETVFFHQRIYFYISLNLFIFFLLAKVIIFVFEHYSLRRMNNFELFLDIKQEPGNLEFALKPPEYMPQDIPMSRIIQNYDFMCQFWFVYKLIYIYMTEINLFNKQYISFIRVYVFSCFFLGWYYLLLYLLFV